MKENVRNKLIDAISIISDSKEILESALKPLPINTGRGELMEKLYFQLTERKLFKTKTELAKFAIENNLSKFTVSTLVNGGLFRVVFDAFDAPLADLRGAVEKLSMMKSIEGKTNVLKPKPKKKSIRQLKKQPNWGNTIRKYHLPNDE
ncbi:MAG: hypothetical protein AAGA10_07350 [Bacteroidota bacterium]